MIVTINGRKTYLDIKKVTGMLFEPKRDEYNPNRIIVFLDGTQMTMVVECEGKEEALKIMEIVEENKQTKTEIDEFKEALEYAIKIVKG